MEGKISRKRFTNRLRKIFHYLLALIMQGGAINVNFLVLVWNYYYLVLIFSKITLEYMLRRTVSFLLKL
jgi:hypothetical protein